MAYDLWVFTVVGCILSAFLGLSAVIVLHTIFVGMPGLIFDLSYNYKEAMSAMTAFVGLIGGAALSAYWWFFQFAVYKGYNPMDIPLLKEFFG